MLHLNIIAENQHELTFTRNGKTFRVFFSFGKPVAAFFGGQFYRTTKTWSKFTSEHLAAWLDGITHERKPQSFFDSLTESD